MTYNVVTLEVVFDSVQAAEKIVDDHIKNTATGQSQEMVGKVTLTGRRKFLVPEPPRTIPQ